MQSCRQLANSEAIDWSKLATSVYPIQSSSSGQMTTFSLGVSALQRLGAICVEQDRLRAQFVSEICRLLGDSIRRSANKISNAYNGVQIKIENYQRQTVDEIIRAFEKTTVSTYFNYFPSQRTDATRIIVFLTSYLLFHLIYSF